MMSFINFGWCLFIFTFSCLWSTCRRTTAPWRCIVQTWRLETRQEQHATWNKTPSPELWSHYRTPGMKQLPNFSTKIFPHNGWCLLSLFLSAPKTWLASLDISFTPGKIVSSCTKKNDKQIVGFVLCLYEEKTFDGLCEFPSEEEGRLMLKPS